MNQSRSLRRLWFYRCLAWSCAGPFTFLTISTGDPLAAFVCALFSGPPMAISLYAFIFYIGPITKRFSFPTSILVQTSAVFIMLTFSFICGVVAIDSIQHKSTPLDLNVWQRSVNFFQIPPARMGYIFTLITICSLLIFWQIGRKLGSGVLGNWITGYYHQPREEERIFMFLDIRGSTTLAEQMGHLKFSAMIQEFFIDMTSPILESKGVVSHYIGDEAVLTWKLKGGLKDANCVRFFFRMQSEIASRAPIYQEKFGVVPEFKAGLHVGHVVACEVGYVKSEVVYLGDVLNTTARIQGLCDSLGSPLLISEELRIKLSSPGSFQMIDMGPQELKGKAKPQTVFAVSEAS